MTYSEDDLLPLSGLQHLIFCERQCALIHVEQAWAENRFTAEGRIMHERVHREDRESTRGIRVEYGMPLRSLRLGLVGKADVVEFHRKISTDGKEIRIPFPVEYKRGRPKKNNSDKVQLCAQALCLEEMLHVPVAGGALFYGKTRRRLDVTFDSGLREETQKAAMRFHALVDEGRTPRAVYDKRCERCSMKDPCLPKITGKGPLIREYMMKAVEEG